MKNSEAQFRRIAIKVGSNVITMDDGSLNTGRILRIVEEIAVHFRRGREIILITSGAVAAGKPEASLSGNTAAIAAKQVWASIGQVKLMSQYQFFFGKYGIQAGQILTTKESFRDRLHYLNMRNCISAMLDNKVLPVVNENDTISVNELMFTDNDELSGMIASMMDCGSLFILSNVDGIFTGLPGCAGSEIIREITPGSEDISKFISPSKSGFGRGGMLTKCNIAGKIAAEGIHVYIANGNRDSVISGIINGNDFPFTHFSPSQSKRTGVKKWLAHSDDFARGIVYVNRGARDALLADKANSLLMIGVSRVEGSFRKGDIIRILDEKGMQIGLGKSQYDSRKAELLLGEKAKMPMVHYDYLLINEKGS